MKIEILCSAKSQIFFWYMAIQAKLAGALAASKIHPSSGSCGGRFGSWGLQIRKSKTLLTDHIFQMAVLSDPDCRGKSHEGRRYPKCFHDW